ncbi:MAG: DUF1559 domain-containing protein [Pirellulales bacterium]|nr:DUF1559 domain-containing protein [Pirellulales bacterium]
MLQTKKSPRRTAIVILAWAFAGSGVLTWLIYAIQAAREAARCQSCRNNLKQLGLGLLCFDSSNGGLPPAYLCDEKGNPIHSWQSLVMPYLSYYSWQQAYNLKEP